MNYTQTKQMISRLTLFDGNISHIRSLYVVQCAHCRYMYAHISHHLVLIFFSLHMSDSLELSSITALRQSVIIQSFKDYISWKPDMPVQGWYLTREFPTKERLSLITMGRRSAFVVVSDSIYTHFLKLDLTTRSMLSDKFQLFN